VFGQIGWSGAGQYPSLEQSAGDEGRWFGFAEAQRGIEAIGDEVAKPVPPQDLERQPRMGREEFPDAWSEHEAGDERIDIDPQPAAHRHSRARCLNRSILDADEVRFDLLIKAPPFLSERDRTRRAVEQADANAVLKSGNRAAHAGLREAERLGCPDKAPGLDDCGENLDPTQQSAVEGHVEPDRQSRFV
jgi:hypothetical protein